MKNSLLVIFGEKFDQSPCTIVQGLWPDFGASLKICMKSKFDLNQLKKYFLILFLDQICINIIITKQSEDS